MSKKQTELMYQLANVSLERTPPGVAGMMAVNWPRRASIIMREIQSTLLYKDGLSATAKPIALSTKIRIR